MTSPPEAVTILVFDPDEAVGEVLRKVLARQGVQVVHTRDAAQVLPLVEEAEPQLALLDCGRSDGKGLELAEALSARYAGLPLVLMDVSPADAEYQARAGRWHLLTKPLDLQELRRVVTVARERARTFSPDAAPNPASPVDESSPLVKEFPMPVFVSKLLRAACVVVVFLSVLAGLAMVSGAIHVPWAAHAGAQTPPPFKAAPLAVELVEGKPYTLAVPEEVRRTLGIRKGNVDLLAEAKKPTQVRPLVMPGSTALDPTRLYRIRARFAPSPSSAEVVEIGKVPEDPQKTGKLETVLREVRSGDKVSKGDLLAVFYSVDVGNMKNNLIDAIYQLKLDDEILKRAEAKAEAVPEVFLLNARRNVQGDVNAINRAVSTLKTWGITEEDIRAVRDEAQKVIERQGKHDQSKDALWARVEIRAPDDGVIIERNVALHEIVVDNTTNLFQIAKVDQLSVFAHVPEDDLPALEALPTAQRRWTVKTVGSDPMPGFIDDIGYLIDPNQHTAVVKGHIPNKDGKLRGGQFISGTVQLPPPADVVEIPIDAVVEDGQQCVVFVQTDPKNHPDHFTMRRVELTHRFERTAFVRSKPFAKGTERTPEDVELGVLPREPLQPGDRLLQSGVGELKAVLLDKESQPKSKANAGKNP